MRAAQTVLREHPPTPEPNMRVSFAVVTVLPLLVATGACTTSPRGEDEASGASQALDDDDCTGNASEDEDDCSTPKHFDVPSTKFPTIQSALDGVASGATIRIAPGTYVESLRIDGKTVRLVGSGVKK